MRMCPSRHLHLEAENAALRSQLDEAVRLLKALLDDEYAEEVAPDVYVGGIRQRHVVNRDQACAFLKAAELIKEEPHE